MELSNVLGQVKLVQWNKPIEGKPIWARDCKDHPDVKPTHYMRISNLLATSGCSDREPYWDWTVLGLLEDSNGNILVVNPGDWIVTTDLFRTVIPDSVIKESGLIKEN